MAMMEPKSSPDANDTRHGRYGSRLLLKVVVHRANVQDREGVQLLLEPVKGHFPRIEKVWVDNAYTGTGRIWIKEHMGS